MLTTPTGTVSDVILDGPAYKAGIAPGFHLVAVNGRTFTGPLLRAAIKAAKDKGPAVELIVENTGYYKVIRMDYHQGERYPSLDRVEGAPARLDEILKPMTTK
jgi:predicted metalloprotease with PDZ domain